MATFDFTNTAPNRTSNNTNQTIVGTAENDVIIAGPASPIHFGRNGPVVDNDDVTGGGGNDVMTGGYGADTFRFNFTTETQTFGDTVTIGDSVTLADGTTYDKPNANASVSGWQTWDAAVDAYIQEQKLANGWDDVTLHESPVLSTNRSNGGTIENVTHSFTWTDTRTVLLGEGDDVITDFGNGNDRLVFSSVPADMQDLITSSVVGTDTLIDYDGGSLLLQGYTGDVSGVLTFA